MNGCKDAMVSEERPSPKNSGLTALQTLHAVNNAITQEQNVKLHCQQSACMAADSPQHSPVIGCSRGEVVHAVMQRLPAHAVVCPFTRTG